MRDRHPEGVRPGNGLFYLCTFVVVAALVLGGGSRSGYVSDVVLQLLAVPLLLVALWRIADLPTRRGLRLPLVFCAAIVLVPLLQIVPLPPEVWSRLPNRQPEVEVFELMGRALPWRPISVRPNATLLSALSLVVPISIFLGTLVLDLEARRRLSLVVLAVGLAAVFLGLSQVAQGPSSPLRFFDFSNTTEATGFFANRNHFAALLYSLTLIAAAWAVNSALLPAGAGARTRRYDTATVVALIASFTILVALVGAQLMARSRAGLGLTIIALLGALALAVSDRRHASGITPAKLFAGALALAVIFATQFALYRVMQRFTADPLQDARIPFALTTIEAAKAYMPFGSGMGTFVPVYALYEKTQDVLANAYANRAHNDVLELWLELGAAGLMLMAAFLAWFLVRTAALWWRAPAGLEGVDLGLARAATLIVGLLIAHSGVDYPLRSGAMMSVLAFACALMLAPPAQAEREGEQADSEARPEADAAAPRRPVFPLPSQQQPQPAEDAKTAAPTRERWGADIEWPEAWRPQPKPGRPKPDDK